MIGVFTNKFTLSICNYYTRICVWFNWQTLSFKDLVFVNKS